MLDENQGYAVFLYPQALEALGQAIRPYLRDGPSGPHVLCNAIDTGGALIEMTLEGKTDDGHAMAIELMVPANMIRMIVSARSDGVFGFGPRVPASESAPGLPPVALASSQPATVHKPIELPSPAGDAMPPPTMAKAPPKK